MGIINLFKDMQQKQKEILSGVTASIDSYKEKEAAKKAEEEQRKQAIADGNIEPIKIAVQLLPNEVAFAQFTASRQALVDKIVEHTTTKSKKKGVVTRAVVGGVLLGPLGALGGAATAGSKGTATTSQYQTTELEIIDEGSIIFTNQRLLFIGGEIVSLPYDTLTVVEFNKVVGGMLLNVKYTGMLKNEGYVIRGDNVKDAELYYLGAKKKQITG